MGRGTSKAGAGNTADAKQESILSDYKKLSRYIIDQRAKKQKEEGLNWEKAYKSTKSYTYDIEGKQIKTNYGAGTYPYWDGNGGINYTRVGWHRTDAEVLKSLIEQGYDEIKFVYKASGMIRGAGDTFAFYKKKQK